MKVYILLEYVLDDCRVKGVYLYRKDAQIAAMRSDICKDNIFYTYHIIKKTVKGDTTLLEAYQSFLNSETFI